MLHKILPFSALLVCAFSIAWADGKPRADQKGKNLLDNGNMEDVVDGKPAKWVTYVADGGKIDLASSDDQAKEGKRCMLLKGNAEWGVASAEKIPLDRKKTYTLTGFARAKRGTAKIKIDYFEGDKHLGMTESDEANANKWEQLKVVAEPDKFPEATHLIVCAVVSGEFEASFDDFVLTAKDPP
jgi:Carbohydrate binding domain